ncbi:signal recognition particle 54 kDa 2-like [Olea europaea subsp. europaea]|uniref:Signal recognition particle 54 kDa 2-like n=1 Tax=Olea europaea subsp. europaea TaxID=158383 RepID=A0A8S0PG46_OLEEU|nr:signal recognition particle 54 kDa 2-like [Olea europaea subsp. europaea]
MGDLSGFMDKVHEVIPIDQQTEFLEKLKEGKFTLRIMFEYVQHILQMGPIGQVPEPPGLRLKREGLNALHPIVLVLGIVTERLELWEGNPFLQAALGD